MEIKPTYCNPIPLENMPAERWPDTQHDEGGEHSVPDFRSVADPSAIYYEGKWILYQSYHFQFLSPL